MRLVAESRSLLESNTDDLAFMLVPVLHAQLQELDHEFFVSESENFLYVQLSELMMNTEASE